jgi:hypothetical protein
LVSKQPNSSAGNEGAFRFIQSSEAARSAAQSKDLHSSSAAPVPTAKSDAHPERDRRDPPVSYQGVTSVVPKTAETQRQESAKCQGTTSVVPKTVPEVGALAPAASPSPNGTILIEGGYDGPEGAEIQAKKRRLNPIRQKQMQDRCRFLEEEIPRVEASIAHTEQQLGVYVSAAETQRLTTLAAEFRTQLAALTAEWENLTTELET